MLADALVVSGTILRLRACGAAFGTTRERSCCFGCSCGSSGLPDCDGRGLAVGVRTRACGGLDTLGCEGFGLPFFVVNVEQVVALAEGEADAKSTSMTTTAISTSGSPASKGATSWPASCRRIRQSSPRQRPDAAPPASSSHQGQHDPGHGLDDVVGVQRERAVDIPQVERKENEGRRRAQQHFVENGGIDLPTGEKERSEHEKVIAAGSVEGHEVHSALQGPGVSSPSAFFRTFLHRPALAAAVLVGAQPPQRALLITSRQRFWAQTISHAFSCSASLNVRGCSTSERNTAWAASSALAALPK